MFEYFIFWIFEWVWFNSKGTLKLLFFYFEWRSVLFFSNLCNTSRAIDWKVFLTMTDGFSWVTVSKWSIMLSTAPLISCSMPLILPLISICLCQICKLLLVTDKVVIGKIIKILHCYGLKRKETWDCRYILSISIYHYEISICNMTSDSHTSNCTALPCLFPDYWPGYATFVTSGLIILPVYCTLYTMRMLCSDHFVQFFVLYLNLNC